jgi:lipopolysaccharide transport system permease protein
MNIIQQILKLYKNRSLIIRMAYKDITDRYAGSSLGIIWTFLQPLLLITIYALVFTFIFRTRIDSGGPISYAFYAIAGLLPWIAIADGLGKSVGIITGQAALVKQAIFPVEVLPISTALTSLIPLTSGLMIYIVAMAIFSPIHLSWLMLLLPIVIFIHFLFICGISYFLSMVGTYFRDSVEIVSFMLTVGMFVTPILYLETSIPSAFVWPMRLNIFAHLIYMYRDIVFYGQINHPISFIIFTVVAILVFILGLNSFNKLKHHFANVI